MPILIKYKSQKGSHINESSKNEWKVTIPANS